MRRLIIIYLGMLFLYPKLYAQDNEPLKNESTKNNYYWLGAGGGIPDLGVNINLNYIVKKVLITGDFAGVVKFNNSEFWDGVDKDCDAYSLLLGTYITDRAGFASISTGVSYISGLDRSESEAYNPGTESVKFRTLGLPIKAQFALHGKYVGVGISGIFNLNKNMPYGLAMLNLSLGKLR